MIGRHLGQVVPQLPAQAEPVGWDTYEAALRSQSLEEEDQLEPEDDNRIDPRETDLDIGITHQIMNEGEIERTVQMTIVVTLRHHIV